MGERAIALVELEPGERLSDLAYTRILESLFDRRLPAGAFVSQNDLVQLIGVPVGPLRDALRVLEAEGVLTVPLAQRTMREHLEIIASVEGRNPDTAETAVVAHFASALQRNLGMFM